MQKSREFLNNFWDLANEDSSKRLNASEGIIASIKDSESQQSDLDYTCKRLCRGLSSSREHARQGFSMCLTELISLDFINLDTVILQIDETTKTTGSIKGSEERDSMLGKLFGVLTIMKSKKLSNKEHIEYIMKILLQLHSWKAWMREIATESFLFLISIISHESVHELVLPKLKDFLNTPVDELAAWQIVLMSGLENYAKSEAQSKKQIKAIEPTESVISAASFHLLKPTLIAATHGFPKIHRVWSSILSSIFHTKKGIIIGRHEELISHQDDLLKGFVDFIDKNFIVNSHEKRGVAYYLLVELVRVCPVRSLPNCVSKRMIKSLISARINKKHTLHNIAESTLKSLVSAAKDDNKIRLLLASLLVQHGGANFDHKTKTFTIQSLLEGLQESDILSHVKQLCHLLGEYISDLSIASSNSNNSNPSSSSLSKANESKMNVDDDDDEEIDGTGHTISSVFAALDGLTSLSKNPNILGRYNIIIITGLISLRMVYFSKCIESNDLIQSIITTTASTTSSTTTKKSKQQNKKDKTASNHLSIEETLMMMTRTIFGEAPISDKSTSTTHDFSRILKESLECLDLVNGVYKKDNNNSTSITTTATAASESRSSLTLLFPKEIVNYCCTKFLSLLSDVGQKGYSQLSITTPSSSSSSLDTRKSSKLGNTTSEVVAVIGADETSTVLQVLTNMTLLLIDNGCELKVGSIGEANDEEVQGDTEERNRIHEAVKSARNYEEKLKHLKTDLILNNNNSSGNSGSSKNNKQTSKRIKLCDCLIAFINQAIFNTICSESVEIDVLEDIGTVCYDLMSTTNSDKTTASSTTTTTAIITEDEMESPQVRIFEICMDFLSVSEDQSVKGMRDTIKRLWTCIAATCPLQEEVFDSIVSIITNEENEDNGKDDDDDDEADNSEMEVTDGDDGDVDEDSDGNDEDDEDDEEEKEIESNKIKKQISKNGKNDEDEEEDIMISGDDMFGLLDGDDDNEGDDEDVENMKMVLQHGGTPEQDAALVQLIELRKASRKLGLLNVHKRQLLVRTRAVDILEIILSQLSSNGTLVMMLPFLKSLKSLHSSSMIMSLQEGRSFEQKLRTLVEEKICKHNKQQQQHRSNNILSEETVVDKVNTILAEDVIDILNEIFECIRSSISPLKHVATQCLFRICRTVLYTPPVQHNKSEGTTVITATTNTTTTNTMIPSQIESIKVLKSKLHEAMNEFKLKKNSKLSRKLFEELFVRFPDVAIESMFNSLMNGCGDAKNQFIQTECCEMLTAILRRFKTLSVFSQQIIHQQSSDFFKCIQQVMEKISLQIQQQQQQQDGNTIICISSVTAKRLKVFLNCVKEYSLSLKLMSSSSSSSSLSKSQIKSIRSLQETLMKISKLANESNNIAAAAAVSATEEKNADKKSGQQSNANMMASLDNALKQVMNLLSEITIIHKSSLSIPAEPTDSNNDTINNNNIESSKIGKTKVSKEKKRTRVTEEEIETIVAGADVIKDVSLKKVKKNKNKEKETSSSSS